MLQWILPTVVGISIVAVVFTWKQRRNARKLWSLAPKELLGTRERSLHRLLLSLYPDHYIFVNVALSQLLEVLPDTADHDLISDHVKQHVAAFVLCRADYSVMAVIELDTGARFALAQEARETKTAKALQSAGLRLVRVPAGPLPDESDLRLLIEGDGYLFMSPVMRKWHPLSA